MTDIVMAGQGLVKSHRGRRVLDNVDIELKQGCITAILGPSGAGKSTLLRVMAGLEDVDSGQVAGSGRRLTDGHVIVPPEKRSVGLVFQDFSLFPHLTALDNVMFGLRSGSASLRRETAMAQLAAVQMDDKAGAYPHTLSGGEQQRVALARALAPEPEIVLLDEAFSGLDARLRSELRDMAVHELKKSGAAVLVVTHDAEEALFMADELVLMVDGVIVQSGTPSDVYLRPVSLSAARLLGDVNIWTGPVSDGVLHSPFGTVNADHFGNALEATLLVRPEGVILDSKASDGGFAVMEAHSLGATTAIGVQAPSGETWQARVPTASGIKAGDTVGVGLDPSLTSIVA
ncbi:MAG: ABC transporter ATP-binding protein [Parasphingorhabdus sp.]